MTNHVTYTYDNALLINQLKARGRRLRKEKDIKLNQAYNEVAREHGHTNWSSLITHLEAGNYLDSGPLSELSGLTRQDIVTFWMDVFAEHRSNGEMSYAADDQPYAGPLSDVWDLDVREFLEEQYPDLAAALPEQFARAVERIKSNGPWVLTEDMNKLYFGDKNNLDDEGTGKSESLSGGAEIDWGEWSQPKSEVPAEDDKKHDATSSAEADLLRDLL